MNNNTISNLFNDSNGTFFVNYSNETIGTTHSIDISPFDTTYFDNNEDGEEWLFILIVLGIIAFCLVFTCYAQGQSIGDYPGRWILYHKIVAILTGLLVILSIIFAFLDGYFLYFIVFGSLCIWMAGALAVLRHGMAGEGQPMAIFWPILLVYGILTCIAGFGGASGPEFFCICRCCKRPWCKCCKLEE